MRKLLAKLLTIFLATSHGVAVAVDLKATPATSHEVEPPKGSDGGASSLKCYTPGQLEKIAQAITDLKKCSLALTEKDRLIQENMLRFDKLNAGPAFWQEPMFVWGGIVVGVSVGSLVTFLVMRNK